MALCPRCGQDGDVSVAGPGRASCSVCGGGFVPTQRVVTSLMDAGVSALQLREIVAKDGQRVRPCPACNGSLTSFPVRRELLHSCTPCGAIWLDASAKELLAGVSPAAVEMPLEMRPLPAMSTGTGGELELGRAPQARGSPVKNDERYAMRSMRAGLDANTVPTPSPSLSPAGAGAGANPAAPPLVARDDEGMFRAPPGAASGERSEGSALWLGRSLKLAIAVAVLGIFYVIWNTAHDKASPTPIGGGFAVTFWSQPVKEASTSLACGFTAKRYLSPWGTNQLEAAYVPGAGGASSDLGKNGRPECILTSLFGQWVKINSGPSVLDNGLVAFDAEFTIDKPGSTKNVMGWARVEFNEQDAFVVSANSDSSLFPRSGKANAFMATLKKAPPPSTQAKAKPKGSGTGDAARAAAGLAPDVD